MSDADSGDPDTFTDSARELEMERGNATERTDGAVVFTDAMCVGCREVTVCNVPHGVREWTPGTTFADWCHVCTALTPHNVQRALSAVNRTHERGYLYTDETDD